MISALRIGVDATEAGIADGERGGVYQYILHLVRHVAAISPESRLQLMFALPHYRHSGTIRRFVAGFRSDNISVRRVPVPLRYLRRWHIPVDLFARGLDVFHAPSHLALRCRATPVVVTVHDLAYRRDRGGSIAPAELGPDEARWWDMRRTFFAEIAEHMEGSIRQARLIITVSAAVRGELIRAFGVDPAKVRVVPLAVRDDLLSTDSVDTGAVRTAYHLDAPYWLYVGCLDPNKNLLALLEGYALYHARGGKGVLAITGQSRFYGTVLRHHAKKLGIEHSVRFLGYVPDADLPGLYRAATGVVMPSPLEGFGLPALEAMACGTPVIAANGGSLPEVVSSAGFLVDASEPREFGEAMLRLDEDRVLRAELQAAGVHRAAQFCWKRAARDTLSIYAEAAGLQ